MKGLTLENDGTLELGVGDSVTLPMYIIVGFVQFNQQLQNNDTCYRPSVVKAQCIIGSEKVPDAERNCKYAFDQHMVKLFLVSDI